MENLNLLNHRISVAFSSYLQGNITLEDFIQHLRRIEALLKPDSSQSSLWFKLSQDDTLVFTIDDLQKDLSNSRNREFTKERMQEAISLENELFIHYS